MGGQDEAVVKAGADLRGAFPRGVRSFFPVRTLPGKGSPPPSSTAPGQAVYMNRNSRFSRRDVGETNFLTC